MDILLLLETLFSWSTLLMVIIGTAGGVFIGAMPGLNGPIGVALLLPFTFGLDPASGLLLLGGIYMGASYGGSITAILLNTPGTAEAACTAIEGNPLAKQGRAKETLYYSILSCVVGGTVGILTLLFFTPILANFALKFGPPEMFLISMAGLAIVGSLATGNIVKGIFAAMFGVFISLIGQDILTGANRFTFGIKKLEAGVDLIPVIIGIFAITEMLIIIGSKKSKLLNVPLKETSLGQVMKDLFRKPTLLIKSSVLGTLIGILPGAGAVVASFMAYGEAKRTSKNKELFGKGNMEGVISAESANNAAVGGSLVPLLALGIPGSATAAVLYGALTIHNLIPGPKLFVNNPEIAYTFILGMLLTLVVMGAIGILGVPLFSNIVKVKKSYIIPIVLAFSLFGAYSLRNNMFDVLLAIVFGVIGLIFKKGNIPTAPVVLGLILGPLIEINFRQTLTISTANNQNIFEYIFTRPISISIALLLVIIIYISLRGIRSVR